MSLVEPTSASEEKLTLGAFRTRALVGSIGALLSPFFLYDTLIVQPEELNAAFGGSNSPDMMTTFILLAIFVGSVILLWMAWHRRPTE